MAISSCVELNFAKVLMYLEMDILMVEKMVTLK
jgi:hypothetical protein